jgi:predicted transcriptional regulator of viral defense system
MKVSEVWFRLAAGKDRIVSSQELKPLAESIGKSYDQTVNYLLRQGYIVRVLRGFFYVKSPEEVKLKVLRLGTQELIAEALDKKGVGSWFFALESALKLNNMTHEYFTVGYVVTDSYTSPWPIRVVDGKYRFLKWKKELHGFGIIKRGKLRYSDPERTVLDLCYQSFYSRGKPETIEGIYLEYKPKLKSKTVREYLKHYPEKLSQIVEGVF